MVVLLQTVLAQAKLDNNEQLAAFECLNKANKLMEQKSLHIENIDILRARILMQYSRWYTCISGDVMQPVECADEAYTILMVTQIYAPYEHAFAPELCL